ncbi:MAG: membrane protein insertase YidC [Desulfatibacillaceae bacterium]
MDQIRLVLAVVLSIAVVIVWQALFVEPEKPARQPRDRQAVQQQDATGAGESGAPTAAGTAREAEVRPEVAEEAGAVAEPGSFTPTQTARASRIVTVRTPLYEARISERGAQVVSLVLSNYKKSVRENAPYKEIVELPEGLGTLDAGFVESNGGGMRTALYEAQHSADSIRVGTDMDTLSFKWVSPTGLSIVKTYRFDPETYLIDYSISIENQGAQARSGSLGVTLRRVMSNEAGYTFEGPIALVDNDIKEVKTSDIIKGKEDVLSGDIDWTGITGRYFLTALVTDTESSGTVRLGATEDGLVESMFVHPKTKVAPGEVLTVEHQVFFGPKSLEILNQAGHGLARALDFGFFDVIAKPFLHLMNFLYGIYPNYGVAIIILTILVKIVFWPLGNKSYESMNQMKKLQPEMQAIREKFKDDKQKMQEETMRLYKTYKINPLGGCLPMLLQIPVFIALYRMLYSAIELRHAPFALWINDLSAPDRLFRFDFAIPFMQPPYGIPVLTVVMGASMFLQQKMSPPPGDPTQAKMMMALPLVFTFIFINFPSGLVLYWLVNNLISMAQQRMSAKRSEKPRRNS